MHFLELAELYFKIPKYQEEHDSLFDFILFETVFVHGMFIILLSTNIFAHC